LLIKFNFMKKLLISFILIISIITTNAQYRDIETRYYPNNMVTIKQPRVNILPTIIGAIVGAAIVNMDCNNYDYNDTRIIMREQRFQRQLEIQRLELLQAQVELLEMQRQHREKRFLGIFPKRHKRYYY